MSVPLRLLAQGDEPLGLRNGSILGEITQDNVVAILPDNVDLFAANVEVLELPAIYPGESI